MLVPTQFNCIQDGLQGPGIVKEMKKELISILKKENIKNISSAVGINA